jgi:hypothetical protein
MKTLIYQINIGKGTQWEADKLTNIINKYCIPSVKNYAKKNNYDYRIYKEDIFENFGKNFLLNKGTALSFNKYLYLKYLDYDQIVYVDTDVYICRNAEKLPIVNNFSGVAEPEKVETHKLFSNFYFLGNDFKYINSGFFITNKMDALKLGNYMIDRIKNKKKGKPKNTDNGLLNEFLYLSDKNFKFKILDKKWNYMPHLDNSQKIKPNIIHFVGDQGSNYLINISKKSENINEYLENEYS